jgi:hypothetical protein
MQLERPATAAIVELAGARTFLSVSDAERQ